MEAQKSIVINDDPVRSYQSDFAPWTVEPRRNRADQFFLVALGKWMDPTRDPEDRCRLIDPASDSAEALEMVQHSISVTGIAIEKSIGGKRNLHLVRVRNCLSQRRIPGTLPEDVQTTWPQDSRAKYHG